MQAISMLPVFTANTAWREADAIWSAELKRCFGKDAGDKRYLPEGKGAPGSVLRVAYDACVTAREAYYKARQELADT